MHHNKRVRHGARGIQNVCALRRPIRVPVFLCGLSVLISLAGGCTPALLKSAARNDVVEVRSLIDRGANVNATGLHKTFAPDFTYMTALHVAAYEGHNAVVEILLQANADMDVKTPQTMITPLYMACHEGHIDVGHTLLEHGAKIDERSYKGLTALCIASAKGHTEIVRALLEKGAAASLSSSYQQNRYKPLTTFTPLYIACNHGHADVVNLLLDYGAEVNKGSYTGATPLHIASLHGLNDIVVILLNGGADVNANDKDGETPLHWAARRGRDETVELLIARGADPEATNNKGKTPSELKVVTESQARSTSAIGTFLVFIVNIVHLLISASP